jgi:hypothetical protein
MLARSDFSFLTFGPAEACLAARTPPAILLLIHHFGLQDPHLTWTKTSSP